MKLNTLVRTLALAAVTAVAAPAMANTLPTASIIEMMTNMNTDKDGMISKTEFMDKMGKIYDMLAKDPRAKGGKITAEILADFRRALPTK